jgi:hypothetical protein
LKKKKKKIFEPLVHASQMEIFVVSDSFFFIKVRITVLLFFTFLFATQAPSLAEMSKKKNIKGLKG